jgi:hypothetical protein
MATNLTLRRRVNFIKILTDKLPRCGGDEWSGSNRVGRCGSIKPPVVNPTGEVLSLDHDLFTTTLSLSSNSSLLGVATAKSWLLFGNN